MFSGQAIFAARVWSPASSAGAVSIDVRVLIGRRASFYRLPASGSVFFAGIEVESRPDFLGRWRQFWPFAVFITNRFKIKAIS